ncbi:MAG: hypothetical protein RLZZ262_1103, partial [Bacteroidota bacterium]
LTLEKVDKLLGNLKEDGRRKTYPNPAPVKM